MEFARRVSTSPELGYKIVGFRRRRLGGTSFFQLRPEIILCCNFDGLADFLRHNVVDEAAIYLPLRSYYKHSAQSGCLGRTWYRGAIRLTDFQSWTVACRRA